MKAARRRFNANPPVGRTRCVADITLRDGSGAQCMRRAVEGDLCRQHHRIASTRKADAARYDVLRRLALGDDVAQWHAVYAQADYAIPDAEQRFDRYVDSLAAVRSSGEGA